MKNPLTYIRDSVVAVIYPEFCVACDVLLDKSETHICWACFVNLEETQNHLYTENAITELFDGIIPLERAASYYFFKKNGTLVQLLHQLKYKGKSTVGLWLGKQVGIGMKDWIEEHDVLVPIPIHTTKKNLRGYNQAEIIAEGITEVADIKLMPDILHKSVHNESQTKKNKLERLENVKNVYHTQNNSLLQNKKVLILDDVVTTGATIISAVNTLLSHTQPRSVSTLFVSSQPFL